MKKRGYTIAELIFAIMLLTAFLLLNITMYTNSLGNVKEMERLTQAINIAIAKTEEIQIQDYDDVDSESDYYPYVDNENYIVAVDVTEDTTNTITIDGDEYNLFKDVAVIVTYKVGQKENTITLNSVKIDNDIIDTIYRGR